MKQKICSKCGYSWMARVAKPKACPRCKNRVDVKRIRKSQR